MKVITAILVALLIVLTLMGMGSIGTEARKNMCREGYVLMTRTSDGFVCVPGYRP